MKPTLVDFERALDEFGLDCAMDSMSMRSRERLIVLFLRARKDTSKMQRFRFVFTWRQFLLGFLFGLMLMALASCSTTTGRDGKEYRSVFGSVAVGTSETEGKTEAGSLSGSGMAVGLRGEISEKVSYLDNMEAGLRVGITGRDAQAEPDGVQVDAESGEISAVGVLRTFLPLDYRGGLSVYLEGFGGYGYNWGSVKGGPVDVSDSGGGLLFGAGAGVDLRSGLRLGIEWSRREFDIEPVEIRADDFCLVLGGVLRF